MLSKLASVSTAGVWMRLPATLAGIGCWLIISHCVLRRLGPGQGGLADNRVTVFTAGAMFLAAWLPFNNGLRPEPLIALGVMATWMLVERSIAQRRLAPAAVAIIVASLTATLAPQGLIALGPLLTGARAIVSTIRRRRATDGLLAPIAVLAASLSLIAVVVFRGQTLATVAESARIKYTVGPTIAWYQELLRYYFLTVESNADGSMSRRFAVLVMLLCLFGMLVVLLRRGRVPGLASGPAWRLIGSTAIGLLLVTLTPTKWAIQFGAFAGLAGALGAVTAFTFARIGLHSRRNLTLYVTALLFVLAWATSGINGWFYVGNYGVPWFDIQPVIASHPVTSMFLTLSILTGLLAAWYHFRMDYAGHTEVKNNRRNRVLASTPLLVVAVIMVLRRSRLDGQGRGVPLPPLHHRQGQPGRPHFGPVAHQLRHGRRRAGRTRPQRRYAATGSGADIRARRPARRHQPGRLQTRGRRRRPEIRPGGVQARSGQLRRLAQQTQRRHHRLRGHRRRQRPGRRERLARGAAVRPGPRAHTGDGQLRREHPGREGHFGVVPAAAADSGPADCDSRRRRRHLVLQGGRRLRLRTVAETAVGRLRPDGTIEPLGRCSRSTSGRNPPGATCGSR